jgi:Lysyl oxidase
VITAASVTSTAGTPSAGGARAFVPDLVTRPFAEIELCRERDDALENSDACADRGEGEVRTVLRVSNQIANRGRGPLEFAPRTSADGDCNGNGDSDDDIRVDQMLYLDGDGNGRFERGVDTATRERPAGCRYYHLAHDHYHLDGYAKFELRRERNGKLARKGRKVSFCISDTARFDTGLPGAPSSRYYDIVDCDQQDSVSGTSVGWYDEYRWKLSGQEIDVTGLRRGKYCLISTADPGRGIKELEEGNNTRKARIRLNPRAAPALGDGTRHLTPLPGRCRLGR